MARNAVEDILRRDGGNGLYHQKIRKQQETRERFEEGHRDSSSALSEIERNCNNRGNT